MDRTQEKVFGICMLASIGISVKSMLKVRRREALRRQEIALKSERELKAIHVAQGRIFERIENGTYSGRGFQAILDDFKFENIVNYEED